MYVICPANELIELLAIPYSARPLPILESPNQLSSLSTLQYQGTQKQQSTSGVSKSVVPPTTSSTTTRKKSSMASSGGSKHHHHHHHHHGAISSSGAAGGSSGEFSLRNLHQPRYSDTVKGHNTYILQVVGAVADFTQQLATIHEQQAEELQILVETFRKRNAELRRDRPLYQSSLFTSWETFLQEVEVDSQLHSDIASTLGRQVSIPILEKTFHHKVQSKKVFTHRESYETILAKTEEMLKKCHSDYNEAFKRLMGDQSPTNMAAYYDAHNAYVQQLHAANAMTEEYHQQTLPKLLDELEDVYFALSDTVSKAVLDGSVVIAGKAQEQKTRYDTLSELSRNVNPRGDLVSFVRSLGVEKTPSEKTLRKFVAPQVNAEFNDIPDLQYIPMLKNEILIDRSNLPSMRGKYDGLRKEVVDLEMKIRQLHEALESLVRMQQRSLESSLYNKANELQEDISLKRFDLRVAQIHLAAVRAQIDLLAAKVDDRADANGRDRKLSASSTGSIKTKWLKAFKSLKGPSSSDSSPKKKDSGGSSPGSGPAGHQLENAHIFQEYTFKKITACDMCHEILRGHSRQGLRCKMCKLNVHPDCQSRAPKCNPKPRLLRRQKSTSEIESRVQEAAATDEETPQSPVHGRRYLNTKTVRMSSVDLPDENEKSLSSASTSPCPSPKPHRLLPTNLYVVLYNFKSRQPDELDLRAGCTITVIDTTDPDWWKGKCLGRVGYFPSKYVTKLNPGERPLQVTHNLQVSDSENGLKLLREQIVIQIGDEHDGMVPVRSGEKEGLCPMRYLQEV